MSAWTLITQPEYNHVWDRFDEQFQFKPSYPANGPGIAEPIPSITYDVSLAWVDRTTSDAFSPLIADLHEKATVAFRRLTPVGSSLYFLDWNHNAYRFDPHFAMEEARSKTFIFPDGDYYIFMSEDFSYGTFGHPWAGTICVFGQTLIDAFAEDPPLLFGRVIRRDGVPVTEE